MFNLKSSFQTLLALLVLICTVRCRGITTKILAVQPDIRFGYIQGTDPITMVFKDSVVPLDANYSTTDELVFTAGDTLFGSKRPLWASSTPFWFNIQDNGEIRGSVRWVTTYIARFIVSETFNSDLRFAIETNPFFDAGVNVRVPARTEKMLYRTSSPTITARVFSNATKRCRSRFSMEVPPDGVIELKSTVNMSKHFWESSRVSSRVSRGIKMMLGLCIYEGDGWSFDRKGWLLTKKGSYHKNVCVRLFGMSKRLDTDFNIEFNQGAVYNERAGLLKAKISLKFSTLKSFRLAKKRNIRSNRIKFNVNHGTGNREKFKLALKSSKMRRLKGRGRRYPRFTVIVEECSFTFVIKGIAERTRYIIRFGSVRDYWGLRLRTRHLKFSTGSASSGITYISSIPTYLPDDKLTLPYPFFAVKPPMGKKKYSYFLDAFKVGANGVRDFMTKAITAPNKVWRTKSDVSKEFYMELVHSDSIKANGRDVWKVLKLKLEQSPGLYLIWLNFQSGRSRRSDRAVIIQQTDLNVAVVHDAEGGLLIWVTSFTSNDVVQGAVVTVYQDQRRSKYGRYGGQPIYKKISEGITNKEGLAYLQVDNKNRGYLQCLVEYRGQYAIVRNLYLSSTYLSQSKSVLTTDRSLYDIGETVNVWAIIRNRGKDLRWIVPNSKDQKYDVVVRWYSDLKKETYTVKLDKTFGTLTAKLKIPNDELAYNGNTYIQLHQNGRWVGSTKIMVAAPRIPTSSLSAKVLTPIINLNGDAELKLQVELLTDTQNPIEGSEVKLYLTTTDTALKTIKKLRTFTTDDAGSVFVKEKIKDIFSGIEGGQSISWEVEVVGPTGELLLEKGRATVQLSEWKIKIDVSFDDFIIPGWPVRATIVLEEPSYYESKPIYPILVLYKESCDVTNRLEEIKCNGFECVFDLPARPNPFHIQASLIDPLGTEVKSKCVVLTDWTADDWEVRRINKLPRLQIQLNKDTYERNDLVIVKFSNFFHSARALFRWGSQTEKKTEITGLLSKGEQRKTIKLGRECTNSCTLMVLLIAGKQKDIVSDFPDFVSFSLLYNEHMPKSVSKTVSIKVNSAEVMAISIIPSATQIQPGETVDITIKAEPFSQVVVMAIDQSYLEVSPHSLPSLTKDYELDLKTIFRVVTLHNGISSASVMKEAWKKYRKMRAVNPFISPCWQWHALSDYSNTRVAFIDQSNELFLEKYMCQYLTDDSRPRFPYRPEVYDFGRRKRAKRFERESFSPPTPKEITPKGTNAVYIRSNFDPNPLFKIVNTNSDGDVIISFELPDDIATFEVRAIGVKDNKFGIAESVEVISSKLVSMQALQPLFVREEDQFDAGVSIALGKDSSMNIVVMRGDDKIRNVKLVGTAPVPVTFSTIDLEVGDHTEEYLSLSTSGILLDALKTVLPVRNLMDPINIGSSMALREREVWKEVISFPEGTLPVNLRIVAGNGFKASVQVLAGKFGNINEDWMRAPEALGVITVNRLLELNGQKDIQYDSNISLEKLQQFTSTETGLRWSIYKSRISIHLNLNAIYFASLRDDDLLSKLVPVWKKAAEREMLANIKHSVLRNATYNDWTTISLAHLAFGRYWKPPHANLGITRLSKNIAQASILAKSYYCLAYYRDPVAIVKEKTVHDLLDELSNTVRVQGQTAYLTSPGSTAPYSQTVHGLIVSASVLKAKREGKAKIDNILQKLAVYVSQGSSSRWYWSEFGTLHAIAALVRYDDYVGSTKGTPTLSIVESSSTLFKETVSSRKPAITREWIWDEVWGEELEVELEFTVQGDGEVRMAISTLYIPALSEVPLSRGLAINRIIQAYDRIAQSGYGLNRQIFQSGELYIVRIEVKTPDMLKDVFLDDYLPGGLEALDPSLYDLTGSSSSKGRRIRSYWCWRCWIPTFHRDPTFMADRVRWFASRLSAGTHEVTYLAIANIPGRYNHPPANAWVSEQPEVMGLSAGQFSLVENSNSDYELQDEHTSEFKSILTDCNAEVGMNEICNMATGKVESMWQVLDGKFTNIDTTHNEEKKDKDKGKKNKALKDVKGKGKK
jgi:hypothetical protein